MRACTGSRRAAWFAGFWGIALVLLLAVGARAQDPNRFENAIQAFEAADRASPPPAEPVLFVGSSTIRMWTDLAAAFPEHAVLNRGFGGSHMSDLLHYFDRVVAVYEPALVLVYEGDNDLASGKSVDHVYGEYVTFLARVKRQLPGTDVAFLAVKPSPSRVKHLEAMRQLNVRLAALAAEEPVLWFVDVFTPMLDAAGQPRPELFGSDLLHMNAAGYALWQTVIDPVLEEWSASRGQSFLFDFGAADLMTGHGPSPNDPVNYWNNVTETIGGSPTGILPGVVNTRNQPTDIVLRMLSPFNGSGPGRSGTVKSTRFVPNATADSLYSTWRTPNEALTVAPSFKLTGLNRARIYNFTFYASVYGFLDDRAGRPAVLETSHTVTGENSPWVAYDPLYSIDGIATVDGIVPDAHGEIVVSLAPTTHNNRRYIFLGVLQMDEISRPKPVVFVEEPADQTVLQFRSVTFRAAVDSTPRYVVQWFKNGAAVDGANEFTYTIPQATLDLDGAVISVRVSNPIDSAVSRGAMLHVVPDVEAPVVLSANTPSELMIRLLFDEQLHPNTATAIDNYRVNAGAVKVAGAVLDADGRTVTLTLVARVPEIFTVSVSGVRDLAGNVIAPGTTITGTIRIPVLLIDFGAWATTTTSGPAPDGPVHFWNNVTDSLGATLGGKLPNLVAVDNAPTGIGLVILSRFNGANSDGTLTSTQFPRNATRDSLFGNTEAFNGLSDVFPSFKLTGLDRLLTYDLTFYASHRSTGDNRETGYTVTGSNAGFAALNAVNNVDRSVTVAGIAPDDSGEITIRLAPTPANNSAYHFTYLGVLKLEPTPAPR